MVTLCPAGDGASRYCWSQTVEDLDIRVAVPASVAKGKQVRRGAGVELRYLPMLSVHNKKYRVIWTLFRTLPTNPTSSPAGQCCDQQRGSERESEGRRPFTDGSSTRQYQRIGLHVGPQSRPTRHSQS